MKYAAISLLPALICAVCPKALFAENAQGTVTPPTHAVITVQVSPQPGPVAGQIPEERAGSSPQWNDIKDLSFDVRDQFFSGLEQLQAQVDAQINELATKRAALEKTADGKELDSAIQEMTNGRFFLTAMGDALRQAPAEKWNERKTKVGLAWERTQAAYTKAKFQKTG